MTDQERSAAREAVLEYELNLTGIMGSSAGDKATAAMHAVLTEHEANLRKRIAKEIKRVCPGSPDALWVAENIVSPPEPPKMVLCRCGAAKGDHIEEGDNLVCPEPSFFEPAEESTR